MNETHRFGPPVREKSRGQGTAEDSAGVEIKAVGAKVRFARLERRVPVHNQPSIIAASGKKRLANPDQVALILGLERQLRIDAGMDEKMTAVVIV